MTDPTTHPDDERLSAYLDGELPAAESQRITERLAAEPELRRRLEALRSATEAARRGFAALDELPMPASVLDMLRANDARRDPEATSTVVPLHGGWTRRFAPVPLALAGGVALLVGVIIGLLVSETGGPDAEGPSMESRRIATGSLWQELFEHQPGNVTADLEGGIRGTVRLTFQDASGNYCRQAQLTEANGTVHTVACRHEGRWLMEAVTFEPRAAPHPGAPYQPATGPADSAIAAVTDSLIGDRTALGAAEERALIRSGWQP